MPVNAIIGLVGIILILAPFIGIIKIVRKNQQIIFILGSIGISLVAFAGLRLISDVTLQTFLALSILPLVFIYVLVVRYFNQKKDDRDALEEDDIIDDLEGTI